MIDDVVVGTVRRMTVDNWSAAVEVSVRPDVVVSRMRSPPSAKPVCSRSMHLALDPARGRGPEGTFTPGSTIPLVKTSTYPSTEQTLSSLSVVVNGGGLTQIR